MLSKSCHNCGWNNSDNEIIICCNKDQKMLISISLCWKPKEKEMEIKPIFESEEELDYFLKVTAVNWGKETRGLVVQLAKEKGYIKKSALEIAEEKFENSEYYFETRKDRKKENDEFVENATTLIMELRHENEKLKGETNQ